MTLSEEMMDENWIRLVLGDDDDATCHPSWVIELSQGDEKQNIEKEIKAAMTTQVQWFGLANLQQPIKPKRHTHVGLSTVVPQTIQNWMESTDMLRENFLRLGQRRRIGVRSSFGLSFCLVRLVRG